MDEITKVVAVVARTTPETLRPSTFLSSLGLSRSLGLEVLRSALERKLGRPVPPLSWKMSIADLERVCSGKAFERPRPAQYRPEAPLSPPSFPIGVGIDMEDIANLPEGDFRSDSFYGSRYSPAEIATALLRAEPRRHLCGIFCAKEALRKSHPDLVELAFSEIEVDHEEGRPFFRLQRSELTERFQFQLSITHTTHSAAAVVVSFVKWL